MDDQNVKGDGRPAMINWAIVEALTSQVGKADAASLYGEYLMETQRLLALLEAESTSANDVLRSSHDFKSTSVLLGLGEIAGVAREIENDMKHGAAKPSVHQLSSLRVAVERADVILRSLAGQ